MEQNVEAAQRLYEPEEYLALERATETKLELFDGQIVAMSGVTRPHLVIAGNVLSALHTQLRSRPCEAYGSDARVRLATGRSYYHPDVTVACGDIEFTDQFPETLLNPIAVVEVLSPSTELVDRGTKWSEYRRLPSLQHYLLVAQDRMSVELYTRQGDLWLYSSYTQPEDEVELAAVGCRISLGDVYDKVEFPPDEPEET